MYVSLSLSLSLSLSALCQKTLNCVRPNRNSKLHQAAGSWPERAEALTPAMERRS